LAIHTHPQGDINTKAYKPTHPIYIYNVNSRMLKGNNGSDKDKNVETIEYVMLTYS
jgi:hypothetical protein